MKDKILVRTVLGMAALIAILVVILPNAAWSQQIIAGTLWTLVVIGQVGIWVSLSKYSSYYARFRYLDRMPADSIPVRAHRTWGLVSLISVYVRNFSFWVALSLTVPLILHGGSL